MIDLLIHAGALFAACAIAAFTARTARERGRSRVAWGALATVAGLAGLIAGGLLFTHAVVDNDLTEMSVASVAFGLVATLIAPLGAMATVLGVVTWLPERVPTIGGARWRVYRLSSPDEPAGECELAFADGMLRIGDWHLAGATVEELVADGECLRIRSGARVRTLMPIGESLTSKEKAKQSQALAKRLRALIG